MEKMNKGELNGFLTILLVLSAVGNVIRYITSISSLLEEVYYDGYGLVIWQTLCSIMVIASVVGILLKRSWGVYIMFGWGAIVLLSEIIVPDYFSPNALLHDFIIYAFWGGLLFLKNDGKSAWYILLNNDIKATDTTESYFGSPKTETHTDIGIDSTSDSNELNIEKSIKDTHINNIFEQALASNEATVHVKEESNNIVIKEDSNDDEMKECTQAESVEVEEHFDKKDSIDTGTNQETNDQIQENSKKDNLVPQNTRWIKSKMFILCCIAAIIVIVISGSVTWYFNYNSPDNKYQRANQLFSEGKNNKALELLTELANDDYSKAKLRLGLLYIFNDSIELNTKLGVKFLKEIAVTDTTALKSLLKIYSGVPCKGKDLSNADQAIYYSKIAIDKGICLSDAYFTMGNAYCDKKDYESAFYYWTKASEFGDASAYSNLGWMFYWGNGCRENNNKAYDYFMKAYSIDPNSDFVLYYLGLMYTYGYGVKKDIMQGKAYLKKSAELGNDDAKKEFAKLEMN